MNPLDEMATIVIGLAEYYDKELSPAQVAMYVHDLKELDPQELFQAVIRYRNDPKNDRFPLPAKLKAMLIFPDSDDDQARDAASRIIAAISKFGPYQPKQAMEYMGELGWLVVQRQGGWLSVNETLTFQNQGILQAQWRDLALSLMKRSRLGLANRAPSLPEPVEKQRLMHMGAGLLQKIPK